MKSRKRFILKTEILSSGVLQSINEEQFSRKLSEQIQMTEEKLVRGIGRWDYIAIVINTIIGAGIFGLPARVYAQIGGYSLIAFVACALIVGLIVLCYAEVSSRFSATGGPYLYAKEAFGSV